jgi:hypothetical protein
MTVVGVECQADVQCFVSRGCLCHDPAVRDASRHHRLRKGLVVVVGKHELEMQFRRRLMVRCESHDPSVHARRLPPRQECVRVVSVRPVRVQLSQVKAVPEPPDEGMVTARHQTIERSANAPMRDETSVHVHGSSVGQSALVHEALVADAHDPQHRVRNMHTPPRDTPGTGRASYDTGRYVVVGTSLRVSTQHSRYNIPARTTFDTPPRSWVGG